MSVDKFGRHSSSHIYTEPGVSVRYVNNNFLRRDGSNDVDGELNMNNNKITGLADPTNAQDVVTKHYVDSRKPVITIWAQELSNLNARQYEWSFGGGNTPEKMGYCMSTSGRILRGSLSSINNNNYVGLALVNIVINGRVNSQLLRKPNGAYGHTSVFNPPIAVSRNDIINFRTHADATADNSIASLLIELDL